MSQPTLSRALRTLGSELIVRAAGRRTRYALRRPLRGGLAPIPVYAIESEGRGAEIGRLDCTAPEGSALTRASDFPWPPAEESRDGWFDGLPYPIVDMRPQGFLGRAFARQHARVLGVAQDPADWSDDDLLHVLTLVGADQSGDLVVGEAADRLFLAARSESSTARVGSGTASFEQPRSIGEGGCRQSGRDDRRRPEHPGQALCPASRFSPKCRGLIAPHTRESMGLTAERPATYEELLGLPAHVVGEIVAGRLVTHPRPAPRHTLACSSLGDELVGPYHKGRGGPGGWWILDEPEIHVGADIVVPDLAGWRRERMPQLPTTAWFELAPDWLAEILSPATARFDRAEKLPLYARWGVAHAWLVDPELRTLEAYENHGGRWVLLATLKDDDTVTLAPFEAVGFPLSALWAD